MGTNINGVIFRHPGETDQVVDAVATATHLPEAVVHVFEGAAGKSRFAWTELATPDDPVADYGELACALSRSLGPVTVLHYSDSTGANEYREFQDGKISQSGVGVGEGASRLFEDLDIRDGDELFDLVYGENSVGASFVVRRAGRRVSPPEPWAPSTKHASKPLLDLEFESLRPARSVFRWLVLGCGVAMGLLVLGILVAFAFEMLR